MAFRPWIRLLSFGFLLACAGAAFSLEQPIDCQSCHEGVQISSAVHGELPCTDCHTGIEQAPEKDQDHGQALATEACDACHGRDARTINRSVHAEDTPCESCHGPAHHVAANEDLDSPLSPTNQIKTCGQCHDAMMDGYLTSVHARALLVSGLVSAPACTDCHGDHGIRSADDERSTNAPEHIPETCGACHAGILRTWTAQSAHGLAWQDGNSDAPVCTTCHQAHAIHEPTTEGSRLHFPDQCGDCHGELFNSYRGSFHGMATDLGFQASAICSDCHTPHANLSALDPQSSIHPDNLGETCGSCHGETTASFRSFDPHSTPTRSERSPEVYYVWLFMTSLLISVFGFFALHDALWLQRSLVGLVRGEFAARPTAAGPHIRRFSKRNIWTHVVVVVTFLSLAATGLPLKFHDATWAQGLIDMLGGLELARVVHRLAAIATFGYAVFHLGDMMIRAFRQGISKLFWGPDSLVPQPQDVMDILRNLRYFLYLGPRPSGGRWGYWEKFDYMAVFWGVPIIGLSGLMLWFPNFFAGFLPGWTLNAAHVVHSDEALLATGFIFVFHFFHTHLRPESFPMDPVIFTGRMPLERFKEERPLQYQRLVDNGELDDRLVDPPTAGELRNAYLFGFTTLTIGLLLAGAIIWALVGQFLA